MMRTISTAAARRILPVTVVLATLFSIGHAQGPRDGVRPPAGPAPVQLGPPAQAPPSVRPGPGAPPASPPGADAGPGVNLNNCLAASELDDRDGDLQRNLSALSSGDICIKQDVFDEGGLHWVLHIIQNRVNDKAVFWMVPHDNETDGFDSAVYGLRKYGGTIVAVETGGKRFNGPQDPNRNFDAGTGLKCREQVAPSPLYTSHVMRWWTPGAPIVALHTNELGYAGDGKGGAGSININKPLPGAFVFRGAGSIGAQSPDDTMVFVASSERPEHDGNLMQIVSVLNSKGINVQYEVVSRTRNDCSLSNYAVLKGIRDYFNIEVVFGDGPTQRRVLDTLLAALPSGGLGPVGKPAAVEGVPSAAAPPPLPGAVSGGPPRRQEGGAPIRQQALLPRPDSAPPVAAPPPEAVPGGQEGGPPIRPQASLPRPDSVPPEGAPLPGAVPGGQYSLQLGSLPSHEEAEAEWRRKLRQFGEILGAFSPTYRIAMTPKGTVYRLMIGPFATRVTADQICGKLREAANRNPVVGKMDCFVSKN